MGPDTHSAILVLIFLNDVVDCVQELLDGARYVSAGKQNSTRLRDTHSITTLASEASIVSRRWRVPHQLLYLHPVCSLFHSLDSLKEAYSVTDLIGDFAEDVFQSSGLLVQVLELLLGPVNHELCRKITFLAPF